MKWVCLLCTMVVSHAHWTSSSQNLNVKVVFLFQSLLVITVEKRFLFLTNILVWIELDLKSKKISVNSGIIFTNNFSDFSYMFEEIKATILGFI